MLLERVSLTEFLLLLVAFGDHQVNALPPSQASMNKSKGNASSSSDRNWLSSCDNFFKRGSELAAIGRRLQEEKKYDEAIKCFTNAINKNSPSKMDYYRMRANCYNEMEYYDEAIADLEEVIKKQSRKEDTITLSRVLLNAENFNRAIEEILALKDINELVNLANELTSKRHFNDALRCYSRAIENDSSQARYFILRGNCYTGMRNFERAIQDFYKAVEKDPFIEPHRRLLKRALFDHGAFDSPRIAGPLAVLYETELEALGHQLYSSGKFEAATRCYTEAINKNPDSTRYYQLRGDCFLQMRDVEMALHDFRHMKELDPQNVNIRLFLCQVLMDYEKFEEAITETIELNDIEKLAMLGNQLTAKKQFDSALRCYKIAIEKVPTEAYYYLLRGNCYTGLKDFKKAALDFHKAVQLRPHIEPTRELLRRVLLDVGKFDAELEGALVDLNDSELASLGNDFISRSKFEEALRCYTEAINKNSTVTQYYKARGSCYLSLKDIGMAIFDLRIAVQANPQDMESQEYLRQALFQYEKFDEITEETLLLLTDDKLGKLGIDFFYQNKVQNSIRCYTEAIKKNSFKVQYYRDRGMCFREVKTLDMAISDFKMVLQMDPNDKNNRDSLNRALFESERYEELIEAGALAFTHSEMAELGEKFFSIEKFEEAIRCYTEAIRKYPDEAKYFKKRGLCHKRMGNLSETASDYQKTVELALYNATHRIDLSAVFEEMGNYTEARNALAKNSYTERMNSSDNARLDEARQKLEEKVENIRLEKLKVYLTKLIHEDAERKIAKMQKEGMNSILRIMRSLESKRVQNTHIKNLTKAFENYDEFRKAEKNRVPTVDYDPDDPRELPDFLMDKISLDIIRNPLITPSGITYDETTIMMHLATKKTDPSAGVPLQENQLRPNLAVKEAAELWLRQR